jgi:hypothetical protein
LSLFRAKRWCWNSILISIDNGRYLIIKIFIWLIYWEFLPTYFAGFPFYNRIIGFVWDELIDVLFHKWLYEIIKLSIDLFVITIFTIHLISNNWVIHTQYLLITFATVCEVKIFGHSFFEQMFLSYILMSGR